MIITNDVAEFEFDPETGQGVLREADGSEMPNDIMNVTKFGWWHEMPQPEEFSIQFGREIHDPRTGKLLGSRRGDNPDVVEITTETGEPVPVVIKPERLGRCYELAGRYASTHRDAELVHGSIQGMGLPRLDHAWVNLPNGDVYEPITDEEWAKPAFEAFFNPQENVTYAHMDTLNKMIDTEHWGPWDED